MIQLLQRKLISDKKLAEICQVVFSVAAALIMVLGFRRIEALQMTEAQIFIATVSVTALAGIFIAVGFLCRVMSKSA